MSWWRRLWYIWRIMWYIRDCSRLGVVELWSRLWWGWWGQWQQLYKDAVEDTWVGWDVADYCTVSGPREGDGISNQIVEINQNVYNKIWQLRKPFYSFRRRQATNEDVLQLVPIHFHRRSQRISSATPTRR